MLICMRNGTSSSKNSSEWAGFPKASEKKTITSFFFFFFPSMYSVYCMTKRKCVKSQVTDLKKAAQLFSGIIYSLSGVLNWTVLVSYSCKLFRHSSRSPSFSSSARASFKSCSQMYKPSVHTRNALLPASNAGFWMYKNPQRVRMCVLVWLVWCCRLSWNR